MCNTGDDTVLNEQVTRISVEKTLCPFFEQHLLLPQRCGLSMATMLSLLVGCCNGVLFRYKGSVVQYVLAQACSLLMCRPHSNKFIE